MLAQEMSNNLKRESATIMNFSKLTLIEWEIEHPSQDQHMSHGVVWNRSNGLNKSLSTSIRRVLESSRTREC